MSALICAIAFMLGLIYGTVIGAALSTRKQKSTPVPVDASPELDVGESVVPLVFNMSHGARKRSFEIYRES